MLNIRLFPKTVECSGYKTTVHETRLVLWNFSPKRKYSKRVRNRTGMPYNLDWCIFSKVALNELCPFPSCTYFWAFCHMKYIPNFLQNKNFNNFFVRGGSKRLDMGPVYVGLSTFFRYGWLLSKCFISFLFSLATNTWLHLPKKNS